MQGWGESRVRARSGTVRSGSGADPEGSAPEVHSQHDEHLHVCLDGKKLLSHTREFSDPDNLD